MGEVVYLRGSSYRMRGKEAVVVPPASSAPHAPDEGAAAGSMLGNEQAERR